MLNLGKEKTPQATNNTKSKKIVVEAPQVVKRTPTKEIMSSNVANKEPQAFKGKEKVTHNSSGGTPRRKLVIHGPVDDKQEVEKVAHCFKGIIGIGHDRL